MLNTAGKKIIILSLLVLISITQIAPAQTNVFQAVPADSLFVVRVHNLEYTLGTVDQFLVGLSPMPVAMSMMGRMQLANAIGDANLASVDMRGDFAVFGIATPKSVAGDIPNVFIGILLHVSDYSKMLSTNKTASQPDANGIATIGPKKILITDANGYALISPDQNYENMLFAAKAIKSSSLAPRLTRLPAKTDSIWAFGDIKTVMKHYGPKLYSEIDKAKAKMAEPSNPDAKAAAPFLAIYMDMAKAILSQTNDLSLALNFQPDRIALHKTLTPIPDSNFAKLLAVSNPSKTSGHKLMAYMPADSIMSMAYNIDKPFIIKLYEQFFKVFGPAMGSEFNQEKQKEFVDLASKAINSLGDSLAFSMNASEKTPPFNFAYVLNVQDQKALKETINDGMAQMKLEIWQQLFKKFGIDIRYTYTENAEKYKDVAIDKVIMTQTVLDQNLPQAKQLANFYGPAFVQKIAYVNDLALIAGGGDVNDLTASLIDKAQSKDANVPQGLVNSIALIPDANSYQFVGTYNYLRLMKMVVKITPQIPVPAEVVKQLTTNSDIAFAGDITKTSMEGYIVIPKQHLMEIKTAMEMAMQHMQQRQAAPSDHKMENQ